MLSDYFIVMVFRFRHCLFLPVLILYHDRYLHTFCLKNTKSGWRYFTVYSDTLLAVFVTRIFLETKQTNRNDAMIVIRARLANFENDAHKKSGRGKNIIRYYSACIFLSSFTSLFGS